MISHTSWWFIFQDQAVAVSDSNPDTMLNPKIGGIIKTTSWLAHESDGDIIRGSSTNTLLCRVLMINVLLCTVYHLLPHCCNCEPEGSDCGWPVSFIYHLFGKEYSFDVHIVAIYLCCVTELIEALVSIMWLCVNVVHMSLYTCAMFYYQLHMVSGMGFESMPTSTKNLPSCNRWKTSSCLVHKTNVKVRVSLYNFHIHVRTRRIHTTFDVT